MTIDKDQLLQLVSARVYSDDLQQALNDTLCKYTIDSDLRVNHLTSLNCPNDNRIQAARIYLQN